MNIGHSTIGTSTANRAYFGSSSAIDVGKDLLISNKLV